MYSAGNFPWALELNRPRCSLPEIRVLGPGGSWCPGLFLGTAEELLTVRMQTP